MRSMSFIATPVATERMARQNSPVTDDKYRLPRMPLPDVLQERPGPCQHLSDGLDIGREGSMLYVVDAFSCEAAPVTFAEQAEVG